MNTVAQGAVDSTIAAHVALDRTATVYYWLAAGEDYAAVKLIHNLVAAARPGVLPAPSAYLLEPLGQQRRYSLRRPARPAGHALQAISADFADTD